MDKGTIIMLCGLPGSGKTTLAKSLEKERGALRISPDEWIVSILGENFPMEEADRIRKYVERTLLDHSLKLANLGVSTILENGFWSVSDRNEYKDIIKNAGLNIELHFLDAPLEVLWERINQRNKESYPYKIEAHNLERWHGKFEKPTDEEGADYSKFIRYGSS